MREELSHRYIEGDGIEIGGLHCPLPVKPGVRVTYVDVASPEEIERSRHPDVKMVNRDIVIDNAETLLRFGSSTLDFVIANHVLEHAEDLIKTLLSWCRVLKPGGIIYAALPDKRFCFDRDRDTTTIDHFFWEYLNGPEDSRMAHYIDWFRNSENEKQTPERALVKAQEALHANANIHWHTFTHDSMIEVFQWCEKFIPFTTLHGMINGSEVIWILKRR